MDWKKYCLEMLTNHASRCTALVNLREELYMLEEKSISPSGTVYDTQPRGGDGAVRGADIMLNNYVRKEDYRKRIAAIKRKVDAVDRALKTLTPEEKYLLNVWYISPAPNKLGRAYERLFKSDSEIYRKKRVAFKKFCTALCGEEIAE